MAFWIESRMIWMRWVSLVSSAAVAWRDASTTAPSSTMRANIIWPISIVPQTRNNTTAR